MERTYLSDVKNKLGEEIRVSGFVENYRNSKRQWEVIWTDRF